MLKSLIEKNRTYRRFDQSIAIEKNELMDLIELARLSSSGRNLQPLKYIMSNTEKDNESIFQHLRWAGYLPEWDGPIEGERPSAYIIMCLDKTLTNNCFWDHGIAAQSIMLGATEKGFGGCMFGAFNKTGLKESLELSDDYEILMVLAIGKPIETVVLEEIENDIKYYRDENKVHHVPKRSLESLIIK